MKSVGPGNEQIIALSDCLQRTRSEFMTGKLEDLRRREIISEINVCRKRNVPRSLDTSVIIGGIKGEQSRLGDVLPFDPTSTLFDTRILNSGVSMNHGPCSP
jgi:hypothetical protein